MLSGEWATSPPPEAGTGAGTAVCVRARPATRPALRLRCVPDSVRRTGLCCGGETTTGPRLSDSFLCLRSTLRHHRSRGARSKESNQAERRDRRTQPALDRNTVASIGVALTGMMTRTRMAWRKMTMIYEIRHLTARRRSPYPSARLLSSFCPRPKRQIHQLLLRHRSTPPDAFAHDHDRQQVSWLAGYRLRPPSQRFFGLQWYLWSSAIRLQLRGQPRICTRICAHRIPLVSPCGHYQSQTWHPIVLRVKVLTSRKRRILLMTETFSEKTSDGSCRESLHRRSIDA